MKATPMILQNTKPLFLFAASVVFLTACGGEKPESAPDKAEAPFQQPAQPAPSPEPAKIETAEVLADTDDTALLKRGKIVWFKCRSCHEVSVDGRHKVGPNLNGIIGAKAGEKEGFVYSDAMKNSEIIWDAETLDAFILRPTNYIKGTKMAFVGISKESDRKAVIKYIEENTKPAE